MLPTPPSLSLTLSELARSGGETARLFFGMRALIAESAPGDGHPVLTVPGYGGDDASIATMRYFLRQLGYRAYALKLGANYEDGARDQIRIHRKHCFRYPFEGYALSYSRPNGRSRPSVGLAGSACSPSRWQVIREISQMLGFVGVLLILGPVSLGNGVR